MATTNVMKMQILLRRDIAANWELHKDIVPASGEPCFVIDKNILKIGDGIHTFEQLEPINGAKVAVDGKSIVLEEGVFKLAGFDASKVGAQPRISDNGGIEWVVPTITIEELNEAVGTLNTNVAKLQQLVGSTELGSGTLLSRVESLENKIDGVGEGTIDAKINAKINEFANKMSDDGTVNTLKELVDYVANHGGEIDTLVSDVTTLQQLVGEYMANSIKGVKVNGTLLDVVDGVVNIDIAQQAIGVKGSEEIDVAEDGTLSIKKIGFDKIVQDTETIIVMDGGSAV